MVISATTNLRKRQKIEPFKVDKTDIDDTIATYFPRRRHLGTIIYNPTTTWELLQIESLHGISDHDKQLLADSKNQFIARMQESHGSDRVSYIPVIPPLSSANINCYLEVKIPYKFIKEYLDLRAIGKAQRKRELWGGAGGLYTDDSDLLSVLDHLGLFEDNLDLSEIRSDWKKEDVIRPAVVHKDDDGLDLLDISVTVLMLPTLKKYYGYYKNGINSRSWISDDVHDGLSFGVYNVKYETYSVYAGERDMQKRAQREFLQDRCSQQENIERGRGWQFDAKCYRELKERIAKMHDGKGTEGGESEK